MRARLAIALALAAGAAVLYAPALDYDFVDYDDTIYVLENPNLRAGLSADTVWRAFREPYETNWIPLTWLSLQIDHAVHGLDSRGYHATNVALHAASSGLLFLALTALTGAAGPSAFVAAVFAAHPVHVESVAWIAERKDTLSGFFFMLMLWAYARYAARPSAGRMVAVGAALAAGLLAKPMLVTAPFVLLLLDVWPLRRWRAEGGRSPASALVAEKLPLFALALAAAAVTFFVQRESGATGFGETIPLGARLANAVVSLVHYVWQSFWPSGLAVFYPHAGEAIPIEQTAGSALLLLGITSFALSRRGDQPALAVGWLWFVGMLVPVLGLVQVGLQARADRYLYLPQTGLALALAFTARRVAGTTPARRRALAAAGAAAIAALALATRVQLPHWQDSISLFTRALAVTRDNAFAHQSLGKQLMRAGRVDEAERHFREARRIGVRGLESRLGLADVAIARGQIGPALEALAAAVREHPEDAVAAGKYGLALVGVGRFGEARPHLERALAAHPGAARLHVGMALVAAALGDAAGAVRHNREALHLDPSLDAAANNLAWLLATSADTRLRDPQEALRLARAAVARSDAPGPDLLDTLAAAQAAAGRTDEAARTAADAARRADAQGAAALAEAIRAREALYRTGRAYVEVADPAR